MFRLLLVAVVSVLPFRDAFAEDQEHRVEIATNASTQSVPANATIAEAKPGPMPFGGAAPSYKTKVPCPEAGPRTMVMVPSGQSNAANYGGAMTRSAFGDRIVNFYEGSCWVAADPLLGSDGNSGSAWVLLANNLIASGMYDRIVIAPIAVGGSSMTRWVESGDLLQTISRLSVNLTAHKMAITHVLWVHGEAERSSTSPFQADNGAPYKAGIKKLASATIGDNPSGSIFVTLASSCPNQAAPGQPAAAIRYAQVTSVSDQDHIYLGPDLDAISSFNDRFDVCHLTKSGLEKFVAGWMNVLTVKERRGRQTAAVRRLVRS